MPLHESACQLEQSRRGIYFWLEQTGIKSHSLVFVAVHYCSPAHILHCIYMIPIQHAQRQPAVQFYEVRH